MDDCLFCKIVKGEIPANVAYEDEKTMVFMNIKPVSAGQVLVIPKAHSRNLLETSSEDAAAVMATIQKIAPAVLKAAGSEAFNLEMNCGAVAGQVIEHTHLHIIPRHADDGLKHWTPRDLVGEEGKEMAEKIKNSLG